MEPQIVVPVVAIALLVVSLGLHEAAHGWAALKCGDTTARDLGRITLNPIAHIDPVMTIAVPAVLYFLTKDSPGGPLIFGGAKPVPVAFHRLRRPWRDMSLVAAAGPATNFLLAIFFLAAWRVAVQGFGYDPREVLPVVMDHALMFNLLLTAFNLIPIPPLDGSRIMAWILPESLRGPYVRLESFGMIIVVMLLISGVLRPALLPVMNGLFECVDFIVSLGGAV